MVEARDSISLSSTLPADADSLGFMLGGLVSGEGSFYVARQPKRFVDDGSERKKFVFQVAMAARDRELLEQLRSFLGVGSLRDALARKDHWQPVTTFTVNSVRSHRAAVIPFAERYLLPGAKRTQFEGWLCELERYWSALRPGQRQEGRSICSVDGCGRLVRGRGLCRSHYYRATGW